MKGLVLKDMLLMRRLSKQILVVQAILIVSLWQQPLFVSSMVLMMASSFSMNLFTHDDYSKWDVYAKCLPVDTKRIVGARYISALFIGLAGMLIVVAIVLFSGNDLLINILVSLIFVLLFISATFPLFYRYGLDQGRWMLRLLMLLMVGAILGLSTVLREFPSLISGVFEIGLSGNKFMVIISGVVLFSLLCLWGSFTLSCKIYSKNKKLND